MGYSVIQTQGNRQRLGKCTGGTTGLQLFESYPSTDVLCKRLPQTDRSLKTNTSTPDISYMSYAGNPKNQDHRKKQLIEAAIQVICENGLANTTIVKVTKASGLSAGIVHYYFHSRDKLLFSTLEFIAEEYRNVINPIFSTNKEPIEIIKDFVRISFRPPIFVYEKLATWQSFLVDPNSRTTYFQIIGQIEKQIQYNLTRQIDLLIQKQGLTHCDSDAISQAIDQLVNYQFHKYVQHRPDFNLRGATKTCLNLIESLFADPKPSEQLNLQPVVQKDSSTESDLLPRWTFTNENYYRLEVSELFRKSWLIAGHVNDIPTVGDFLRFDALGQRAIIIRGNDTRIRALENSCKHMGTILLENYAGHCKSVITCPFHEWLYDFKGNLLKTPKISAFENIDKKYIQLIRFNLEIWNGFIFIQFEPNGASVSASLESVNHLFSKYDLPSMFLAHGVTSTEVLPFNWKVIQLAEYDLDQIPPRISLTHQLFGNSSKTEIIDQIPIWRHKICNSGSSKFWSIRNYQALLPNLTHLPTDLHRTCVRIAISPHLIFTLYPNRINYTMTLPESASSTRILKGYYELSTDQRDLKIIGYLANRIESMLDQQRGFLLGKIQQGLESKLPTNKMLNIPQPNTRCLYNNIQSILPIANLCDEPESESIFEVNNQLLNLNKSS